MLVSILVVGLLIGLGALFSTGRGAFLIAGYNTMPPEKQATYDTPALCRFMGKMMFVFAFCVGLWILSDVLSAGWLFTVGMILYGVGVAFLLVYVNTGNRFKKSGSPRQQPHR
ncbi:MAG TPA: DUF3784 domain-containing protein [Chloroflexi bacterium]|jgi:hypothetical protein|nr:DUF3784 domain-containing protein [Chloroflexota bacterium]